MTVCGTLFDGEAFLVSTWSVVDLETAHHPLHRSRHAHRGHPVRRCPPGDRDRPSGAHVAAEIGVGEQLLGRWVRLARGAASAGDTAGVLDADERAELERLRRENAELRLDREF